MDVLDVEELQISKRRKESLFVLSTGERIVLTERRNCPTQVGIDGVIYQQANGARKWLHHVDIDGFKDTAESESADARAAETTAIWRESVRFRAEELDSHQSVQLSGLRPPQIGALHAIGSHWSLYRDPATIVMPTGTGKTETMLAALAA